MARETKVGLIVGLGVILFVSVFVSDYLSVPKHQDDLAATTDLANYNETTTNQPQFVIRKQDGTQVDPRDPNNMAAVMLDRDGRRVTTPPAAQRDPAGQTTPPFRDPGPLPGSSAGHTPPAQPLGDGAIDDPRSANSHHLPVGDTAGPGVGDVLPLPDIEPRPGMIEHTVAAGQTLTAIAKKYYDGDGHMWMSIRDANPGKVAANGAIREGTVLIIPRRSARAQDPVAGLAERGESERAPRTQVRMVTVKQGDSLSRLASKHLGSAGKWQMIMDVNTDTLKKPTDLKAGMKLRIPTRTTIRLIEEANRALQGPADEDTTADSGDTQAPTSGRTYTVKSGDNLSDIALKTLGSAKHYKKIYQANRDKLASPDAIKVGMKLKIPAE